MTQHLADGLVAISKSHRPPNQKKLERQADRLERMAKFYREKIPDAPEKQAALFEGFVDALMYGITLIRMYQALTIRLSELSSESDTILK